MLEGDALSRFCERWRTAEHYLEVVESNLRKNVLAAQLQLRFAVRHASRAHVAPTSELSQQELDKALQHCSCCEYDAADALLVASLRRFESYSTQDSKLIERAFGESADRVRDAHQRAQSALSDADERRKKLSDKRERGHFADELRRAADSLRIFDAHLSAFESTASSEAAPANRDNVRAKNSGWKPTRAQLWATVGTVITTLGVISAAHWKAPDVHEGERPTSLSNQKFSLEPALNFAGRRFRKADLSRFDFGPADLSKADLSGADLTAADLSKANLFYTDFEGAILVDADLRTALDTATLSGAKYSTHTRFPEGFKPEVHQMKLVP